MSRFRTYVFRSVALIAALGLEFIVIPATLYGQDETAPDTEEIIEKKHSPKLAAGLSAALPGLGQIYNKKYWKVPVIYAGAATLVYFTISNNKQYNIYKDAYSMRVDGDTNTLDIFDSQLDSPDPKYTDDQLLNEKDRWRRYRDINIIFSGLLYMLNIVDAAVDAHFFKYKISDDLSLNIHPALMGGMNQRNVTGVGLTLTL